MTPAIYVLNEGAVLRIAPALAVEIGLDQSIVLLQIDWLTRSRFGFDHQGRRWVTVSAGDLVERYFPFWSTDTVGRLLLDLRRRSLLTIGRLSSDKRDRTHSYAIDANGFSGLRSVKLAGYDGAPGPIDGDESYRDSRLAFRKNAEAETANLRSAFRENAGSTYNENQDVKNEESATARCAAGPDDGSATVSAPVTATRRRTNHADPDAAAASEVTIAITADRTTAGACDISKPAAIQLRRDAALLVKTYAPADLIGCWRALVAMRGGDWVPLSAVTTWIKRWQLAGRPRTLADLVRRGPYGADWSRPSAGVDYASQAAADADRQRELAAERAAHAARRAALAGDVSAL